MTLDSKTPEQISALLASLIHDLTIVARVCADEGTESLRLARLRAINELMHGLSGALMKSLEGDIEYANALIPSAFLHDRDDRRLAQLLSWTVGEALKRFEM